MNICTHFPFRLAKDLPDLAQHQVRLGAVVKRFRFWPNFEPDQR